MTADYLRDAAFDDAAACILHGLPLGVCRALGHDANDDAAIARLLGRPIPPATSALPSRGEQS